MDKIVVIGKIKASNEQTVDMEYEAASGTREVRLPRHLFDRIESIGDGRTAIPVSYTHLTLPTICSV